MAFEYTRNTHHPKPHTLIFIGGLGDGLGTVEYVTDIIEALYGTKWSVFAPVLSSSYSGWGTGSIGRDIDEIAQCVQYARKYKESTWGAGKVVVMGHSTGCQDILHYLSCVNPRPRDEVAEQSGNTRGNGKVRSVEGTAEITRPAVDGAIIQAPVSDREAILWELKTGTDRDSPAAMQEVCQRAVLEAQRSTYEDQDSDYGCPPIKRDTLVPETVTARIGYPAATAVSSRRFLSLVSPNSPQNPDEDDMFSSDLGDEALKRTFGAVRDRRLLKSNAPLMVLYSGRDQSVPPYVDKEVLLRRWRTALGGDLWHTGSMIIPGASHALSDDDQAEPRQILVRKVLAYLGDVEV